MENPTIFHFIYLTINLVNLKIYVGKRVILNNYRTFTYLGSGERLKLAVKK